MSARLDDVQVALRALLADPRQGGAFFIDSRDGEAMRVAARSLEFATITIDLAECGDKAQVLHRIATALRFPPWFGGNWDALADSLSDLSWWPAPGYLLVLEQVDRWREQAPDDCATIVDILNDASARWAVRKTPFWTLMPVPAEVLAVIES